MMERKTFHSREVLPELTKNYVEGRLHIDVNAEWSKALRELKLERLDGDQTLPFYEIIDPETREVLATLRGAQSSAFAGFLRDAVEGRQAKG